MFKKSAFLLLLFFTLCTCPVQAQNNDNKTIDSLKTALKQTKNKTQQSEILISLSSFSDYIGPDKAINYAKKGLLHAQKINDTEQIGLAYTNIGIAYEIKSDYPHALKNFYNALEISEKNNDTKTLTSLYNNIGLIYIDLKNYKQGLIFYKKALQTSYQTNKERNISLLLNNIGDVYLQKKEFKKALTYFYKALIINKKNDENLGIGINLTNIGICYINIKNYEKGIEMLNKSIIAYNDNSNLYNNYNYYELGRAYYLMSQDEKYINNKEEYLDKSIGLLENALQNFIKYNSLKDIQETYYYLSKGNKIKGNFETSLDFFEKYAKIKDSIFSEESEKKMANLEFQREIDLRDKQIEIQNLRIYSDSRKVYLLIATAAAVATLLGLFLFLYISNIRNNKLLKEKNTIISNINLQKDKFYSIIAHDLRGPFNGFLGLTELMAEDIDDMSNEEIKFAAANMRSSAKNLFELLENLLEWTRMEQNLVPFEPMEYLLESTTLESIVTLYNIAKKKEIRIHTQIPSTLLVFSDKNMFQAVIRNIVLNAIKFTPKKGEIHISALDNHGDIIITIKDSGIGMHQNLVNDLFKVDTKNNRIGTENEPSTGLGLILCKEFVEKHKGKIWVESEEGNGSAFHISFPKKQME
ncbi:tetratricopeptide repeat-containing sensor histidine kinase [Flavobacterium aquicola]|uniref:histidine kinase n=1 Tax=Flavobacterium aquicola TaxID=1682742 RepID=A0A3E0EVY7_9FLAO|nr:tetratricopeptide repeat-containing sensor histidine kinase [Flavobacterium aquicola]REH02004.1 signal transduction histidine kinase [Flavobacterium aquicola]